MIRITNSGTKRIVVTLGGSQRTLDAGGDVEIADSYLVPTFAVLATQPDLTLQMLPGTGTIPRAVADATARKALVIGTSVERGELIKETDTGKVYQLKASGATSADGSWQEVADYTGAAYVAPFTGTVTGTADSVLENIAAAAGACAGGATPSATQVDAAIATAVAPIVTGLNLQVKEFMTKINAILTSLQNDGKMAAS